MPRQKNDGRGRLGGRVKGVPNKRNAALKEWLSALLNDNRDLIEADFKQLSPADRVRFVASILPYVVPKLQAVEARVEEKKIGDSNGAPVIVFSEPKSPLPEYRSSPGGVTENDLAD
mgnify:CR=1 FL=1